LGVVLLILAVVGFLLPLIAQRKSVAKD
jgi:hypothetical protein